MSWGGGGGSKQLKFLPGVGLGGGVNLFYIYIFFFLGGGGGGGGSGQPGNPSDYTLGCPFYFSYFNLDVTSHDLSMTLTVFCNLA